MDFRHNPLALQFLGFINTQSLFNSRDILNFPVFDTREVELSEILELPLELPDHLLLGKRVEYFFASYIQHFSSETILFENHVISKNRITIGELDYIFQDRRTREITHIELIFKYYLYDPNFEKEPDRWIGPNRKDTLVKKLEKLRGQQFPLLFREETRKSVEPITGPVDNIQQQVCFKASLFVPLDSLNQELPLINNAGIIGYWIKKERFSEEAYGRHQFYSPKKANWPIDPIYCCTWYSYQEIFEMICPMLSQQISPLLWMKKDNGSTERFFVVWW